MKINTLFNTITMSCNLISVIVSVIGIKIKNSRITFGIAMAIWGIGAGVLIANIILKHC